MNPSKRHGQIAALALGVIAVDLVTKAIAERSLERPTQLLPGLDLELGYNSGVAFGALAGLPSWVLILGVAVIILALLTAVRTGALRIPWPAIGLLLGGAVGNLVDRLGDGRVTDFIDPVRWAAFNVADVAITGAIAILLWRAVREPA